MAMMSIAADIIKFFQAFIRQMAKVGGKNLPKTISTSLGAELAKAYQKRDIQEWKIAVTGLIEGEGGKLEIIETSNSCILKTQHPSDFCPVGGKMDPAHFEIVTESLCRPYMRGFLKGFEKIVTKIPPITKCIVRDGGSLCEVTYEF